MEPNQKINIIHFCLHTLFHWSALNYRFICKFHSNCRKFDPFIYCGGTCDTHPSTSNAVIYVLRNDAEFVYFFCAALAGEISFFLYLLHIYPTSCQAYSRMWANLNGNTTTTSDLDIDRHLLTHGHFLCTQFNFTSNVISARNKMGPGNDDNTYGMRIRMSHTRCHWPSVCVRVCERLRVFGIQFKMCRTKQSTLQLITCRTTCPYIERRVFWKVIKSFVILMCGICSNHENKHKITFAIKFMRTFFFLFVANALTVESGDKRFSIFLQKNLFMHRHMSFYASRMSKTCICTLYMERVMFAE